jgi:hypothetical protein
MQRFHDTSAHRNRVETYQVKQRHLSQCGALPTQPCGALLSPWGPGQRFLHSSIAQAHS